MASVVRPETYIRAEVDGRLAIFQQRAGNRVNEFYLITRPTPTDEQPVVRMNRDTLYGGAVIDTERGARVFVPEPIDDRYMSVFLIDNDHYVLDIFSEPGWHDVHSATKYCAAIPRVELRDPGDEADIALVNSVLSQFAIEAGSADPFAQPDWDWDSMFALRAAYEEEFRSFRQYQRGWMGERGVADDATRHLAVAGAWGLFPEREAVYINYTGPADGSKGYTATYAVPPHDAFWSISVYGKDAFFVSDNATLGAHNTTFNDDGTFTVFFGSERAVGERPNRLDISDGWNFLFRIYRPGRAVLDREYVLPGVVQITN